MSYSVTGSRIVELTFKATADDTIAIATDVANTRSSSTQSYSNGTGDEQINQHFRTEDSLTAGSGFVDFDLSLLTNRMNDLAGFSFVKEIYIRNVESETGASLVISPSPSNGWTAPFKGVATSEVEIPPGGYWGTSSPYAGFPVTTGSRRLRFTHDGASAGSITYQVIFLGLS